MVHTCRLVALGMLHRLVRLWVSSPGGSTRGRCPDRNAEKSDPRRSGNPKVLPDSIRHRIRPSVLGVSAGRLHLEWRGGSPAGPLGLSPAFPTLPPGAAQGLSPRRLGGVARAAVGLQFLLLVRADAGFVCSTARTFLGGGLRPDLV